ncbi:hypothetical protein HDE_04596 [Halotydeus destructor]|nr:hypothetical protein HDE_04596 [Halotydeus destructor]
MFIIVLCINLVLNYCQAQINTYGVDEKTYHDQCSWTSPPARVEEYGYLASNDSFHVKVAGSENYGTVVRAKNHRGQPLGTRGLQADWSSLSGQNSLDKKNIFEITQGSFFFKRDGVYGGEVKQLIGCPASLCVASGVDFLNYKASTRQMFVQLGFHQWSFAQSTKPYLTELRPTYNGVGALAALNFPELRYTVFLTDDNSYALSFENSTDRFDATNTLVYTTLKKGSIADKSLFQKPLPKPIDAATVQRYNGIYFIHVLSGGSYSKYALRFVNGTRQVARGDEIGIVPVETSTQVSEDLKGIDEMFFNPATNELYLFKAWLYYRVKVAGNLENTLANLRVTWSPIHQDLFGCHDSFYSRYQMKDYAEFQKMVPHTSPSAEWTSSEALGCITLVVVILAILAIFLLWKCCKKPAENEPPAASPPS